jgi:4-hydroxy-3-polyprenylbenzoate decarboxylase
VIRELATELPGCLKELQQIENAALIMPGVIAIQIKPFTSYEMATKEMEMLNTRLQSKTDELQTVPVLVICDDARFISEQLRNFLWVTFTRCNPSHDMYGIDSFTINKHWGCKGPLVFDARIKPHHAPPVVTDAETDKKIDKLFNKGGSLYNLLP